jgi:hypothetical protein
MPATVIDNYGTELLQTSPGNIQTYGPLKANIQGGKVRATTFTRVYTTEAAGDDSAVAKIPKGARIINGWIQTSATTGAATIAVGLMGADASGNIDDTGPVSDNTAILRAAAAITTTAPVELAATVALSRQYEAAKDLYLTITTAAAAMAGQTLSGVIFYSLE